MFHIFLDDCLKQIDTSTSLKEQQRHKHNNTNILCGEITRKKTPQKFLSIELNQCSVKSRQQLLLPSW